MRLTTLARKIDKTPTQLISFLKEKGVEIPNGLHSKLDDDIVDMVKDNFLPDQEEIDEIIAQVPEVEVVEESAEIIKSIPEDEAETAPKVEEIQEEVIEKPIVDEVTIESVPEPVEEKIGTVDDMESEDFEEINLIKAKKVKLEGIKVVGKIELPEKPKKEETKDPGEKDSENTPEDVSKAKTKSSNRKFDRDRKKNRKGQNRNPLSYEDKLKEEAREKLKKRRRRENAERRRKTKYYQENIEPKITKKQKKKKVKKELETQPIKRKEVVVHKNPIKRLWAWLNGEYDKH